MSFVLSYVFGMCCLVCFCVSCLCFVTKRVKMKSWAMDECFCCKVRSASWRVHETCFTFSISFSFCITDSCSFSCSASWCSAAAATELHLRSWISFSRRFYIKFSCSCSFGVSSCNCSFSCSWNCGFRFRFSWLHVQLQHLLQLKLHLQLQVQLQLRSSFSISFSTASASAMASASASAPAAFTASASSSARAAAAAVMLASKTQAGESCSSLRLRNPASCLNVREPCIRPWPQNTVFFRWLENHVPFSTTKTSCSPWAKNFACLDARESCFLPQRSKLFFFFDQGILLLSSTEESCVLPHWQSENRFFLSLTRKCRVSLHPMNFSACCNQKSCFSPWQKNLASHVNLRMCDF